MRDSPISPNQRIAQTDDLVVTDVSANCAPKHASQELFLPGQLPVPAANSLFRGQRWHRQQRHNEPHARRPHRDWIRIVDRHQAEGRGRCLGVGNMRIEKLPDWAAVTFSGG